MVRETSGRVRTQGNAPTAQDPRITVADRDVTERRRVAGRHIDARHLERHQHLRAGESGPDAPADPAPLTASRSPGRSPPQSVRRNTRTRPRRGRTGDPTSMVTEHAPDPDTTACHHHRHRGSSSSPSSRTLRRPRKPATHSVGRRPVFGRRCVLHDTPVAQHHDPVGHASTPPPGRG